MLLPLAGPGLCCIGGEEDVAGDGALIAPTACVKWSGCVDAKWSIPTDDERSPSDSPPEASSEPVSVDSLGCSLGALSGGLPGVPGRVPAAL